MRRRCGLTSNYFDDLSHYVVCDVDVLRTIKTIASITTAAATDNTNEDGDDDDGLMSADCW